MNEMKDFKNATRLQQILSEKSPHHSVPLSLHFDDKGRRFRLCRLGQRDLEQLVRMYAHFNHEQTALGLPPRGEDNIRQWITQLYASDVQLIAKHEREVAAHAAWIKSSDTQAEVIVFVHQAYQRLGLGKKLLLAVVTMARFMGLDILWAEVENRNARMIHINHQLGFQTVGLHQGSRQMTLDMHEAGP